MERFIVLDMSRQRSDWMAKLWGAPGQRRRSLVGRHVPDPVTDRPCGSFTIGRQAA